jgi:hypothetical protein
MKNFERLNKHEMKMVLGGTEAVGEIGGEGGGGSCSIIILNCSNGTITCPSESTDCAVNKEEEWVICDGVRIYCQ